MTTVSGTFTGGAKSAYLSVGDVPQVLDYALSSGTWTTPGGGISLQRESPAGGDGWVTVAGPFTADASGIIQTGRNERYRWLSALTAGSVPYSLADRDQILQSIKDEAGNPIVTYKESGVFVETDLQVGAGLVQVNFVYGEATPLDNTFFVALRKYTVKGITVRPLVVGSDGSAVTAAIKKAPSGTAIASGTALHSSSADLKGTINTNQSLTLSTTAADLEIASGDAIGMDCTGTMTAARGVVSVLLAPKI